MLFKTKTVALILCFLLITASLFSNTAVDIDNEVTVAVFSNAQPLVYTDSRGNAAGIFPELLQVILEDEGYEVEFRIFPSFSEAFAAAVNGDVDIMPALVKTAEREKFFNFGSVALLTGWSQVFAAEGSHIESVFDLRDRKVGIQTDGQNGKNFIEMMEAFDIPFILLKYDTFDAITEAILTGEVDAGIYFSTFFNRELKIKPTNIVFSPSNSYIAASKSLSPEVVREIDESLDLLKSDTGSIYFEIMKQYGLAYQKEYTPQWLIILVISLSTFAAAAIVFIILLRYLVKKTTWNLNIEKERAEESDRLKTGFLSKVSHELRTPLNGIMGMHTLLKQTELDGTQQNYLYLAGEATNNLYKIIQNLLDLNESSRPEFNVELKETDVDAVIESVIENLRPYAENRGISILYNKPEKPVLWDSDKRLLQQVIIQLLFNAVDFSNEGSVAIDLKVGKTLRIIIKDQGIGISPEKFEEIFIPFHQLENPFTRQQGGLGVGLSIAKQICSSLKAEIKVNSNPGKGSEFIIRIY